MNCLRRQYGTYVIPDRTVGMVDTARIRELLPHYLAMVVLITIAFVGLRATVGDLGFLLELLVVLAIVFVYPFAVRRLGVAPSDWE